MDGTANVWITPTVALSDSKDRFENGTLTQNGTSWTVLSNDAPGQGTFKVTISLIPPGGGGQQQQLPLPVPGPFQSLVDDDTYQDNADILMPLVTQLPSALADAFIEVAEFFYDNPNVPFDLNVEDTEFDSTLDWDTAPNNSNSWWVAYLLGGHQAERDTDNDPETEVPATLGETAVPTGGSIIYLEAIYDRSSDLGVNPFHNEEDTVVHEVGHAVAKRGHGGPSEPNVTTWPAYPPRYTEFWLDKIRSSVVPACCPP
jgi:hypothetical protein